jgi:hypothetical protein
MAQLVMVDQILVTQRNPAKTLCPTRVLTACSIGSAARRSVKQPANRSIVRNPAKPIPF